MYAFGQDQGEEAREPGVEFGVAEAVEAARAFVHLFQEARRAQDGEVVAGGGFRHREVEGAAGPGEVGSGGEFTQDRAAHGIRDGVQGVLQPDFRWVGVDQVPGPASDRLGDGGPFT